MLVEKRRLEDQVEEKTTENSELQAVLGSFWFVSTCRGVPWDLKGGGILILPGSLEEFYACLLQCFAVLWKIKFIVGTIIKLKFFDLGSIQVKSKFIISKFGLRIRIRVQMYWIHKQKCQVKLRRVLEEQEKDRSTLHTLTSELEINKVEFLML